MDALPTDAALIERSLIDPEMFGEVFDRHFVEVHRFVERRLGRDPADELAGEVFRIAFEQRGRYLLERPNCLPWLYGIAANLIRRQRRNHARYVKALGRVGHAEDTCEELNDAERRIAARAGWPQIAAAVAALRDPEREVLLLVAWENLSHDEVADVLGIPPGTARSRLWRARQHLRERLREIGEEPLGQRPRAQRR